MQNEKQVFMFQWLDRLYLPKAVETVSNKILLVTNVLFL